MPRDLREKIELEAAQRGVTEGFIRAEMTQNLRRELFGAATDWKAPISKESLVRMGTYFWPHTFANSSTYDEAVTSILSYIQSYTAQAGRDPRSLWALIEAIEVPDAHIQLMGACRWVDQGLPVVILGERYAAALMSTSVPEEILQDVRAPWKAFLIEIPPLGLTLQGNEGESDEIRRIFVWAEPRSCIDGQDGWAYFTMCNTHSLTLWFIDTLGKLAEEDVNITSQWNDLPFGLPQDDRDKRIRLLLHRLILNTCLAMSDPSNLKAVGGVHKKPWSNPSQRFLKDPVFRHFQLGSPVRIDCRETVRGYVDGNQKRSSLNVRVMVRGHWKNQPHGPKSALRKVIWVEPYWKGDPDGAILVRPHQVEP